MYELPIFLKTFLQDFISYLKSARTRCYYTTCYHKSGIPICLHKDPECLFLANYGQISKKLMCMPYFFAVKIIIYKDLGIGVKLKPILLRGHYIAPL